MDRKYDPTEHTLLPKIGMFEDLFENGMKRTIGDVAVGPESGLILNLGAGKTPIGLGHLDLSKHRVIELDRPDWEAPILAIADCHVSQIHAYHFFEHLDDEILRQMLEECERVLVHKGVLNICVPYARADLAFQDIDHKSFFTEETWATLLDNPYYNTGLKRQLKLHIGCNIIAGVKGRNLAVFTQMMKGA